MAFTNGFFRSIGGGGYGQNLAMWGSSGNPEAIGASASVARAASNGWYNNELGLFPSGDYGKGSPDMSNFSKWGHYSQLVWKGSKKVGCATKFCPAGTLSSLASFYTVCNYFPAGNFFPTFPFLVPRLTVLIQATWAVPTVTTSSLPRARRPSRRTTPSTEQAATCQRMAALICRPDGQRRPFLFSLHVVYLLVHRSFFPLDKFELLAAFFFRCTLTRATLSDGTNPGRPSTYFDHI